MNDQCIVCRLALSLVHLHVCQHCGNTFCTTHMLEHDNQLVFTMKTVPDLVKQKVKI